MHIIINMIERDIIHILFKSASGLDAFTIFRRLKIPFSNFSRALLSLNEKKLIIEIKEDFYKITTEGKYLLTQSNLRNTESKEAWNAVPTKYKSNHITPNSKYIPSIRLLDKSTFNFK
ncbi:hypothetical protein C9426_35055 [Serratia sp. S1B]|nr:hypothetical protein C9426_35055 [Serratia sp. S1B]